MESELHAPTIWRKPWFERIYYVGLVVKAIDATLELLAGVAILISPRLVHMTLNALTGELGEHNARPFQFIAEYVGHVDTQLLQGGLVFLTLFLILHGAIKIGVVVCLVKRLERAYPVALIILIVFLAYEIYVFAISLSIPLAVFIVLDILIVWLVWNEYQELKTKAKKVVE